MKLNDLQYCFQEKTVKNDLLMCICLVCLVICTFSLQFKQMFSRKAATVCVYSMYVRTRFTIIKCENKPQFYHWVEIMLLFLYPPLWEKNLTHTERGQRKEDKETGGGKKAYIQMVEKEAETNKREEESVTKKARSHSKTPRDSENICAWLWEEVNLF